MRSTISLITTICYCFFAYPQINLHGVIKAKKSKKELSFVNIGIIGKDIGTVSNEKGEFYLSINENNLKDSIKISMIGYESKKNSIKKFRKLLKQSKEILLVEKTIMLDEIIVSNRKLKIRTLGNRSKSRKNLYEASIDLLGSEIGVKIKIKDSPTLLKKFNAKILTRKYQEFKFRLNIYNIKDGLPNINLLKENIIIDKKNIQDGIIDVNLEPYNIYVHDDFFVTLEWIKGNENRKLRFPASLFGPVIVERKTSHAKWNRHTIASIGFNVTVQY